MHPVDYIIRIKAEKDPLAQRAIMARIALNILFDSHVYPVDLSELSELGPEAYLLSRSLLSYCRIFPQYVGAMDARDLNLLERILDGCKEGAKETASSISAEAVA